MLRELPWLGMESISFPVASRHLALRPSVSMYAVLKNVHFVHLAQESRGCLARARVAMETPLSEARDNNSAPGPINED